nr:protease inhibitor I42 family protein [Pedobacter sp. ASV19]
MKYFLILMVFACAVQKDSTILAKKGTVFTIDLTAAVGQGFSWQLRDSVFGEKLRYMEQTFSNKKNTVPGSDGIQHFSFKAIRSGKTALSFIYVQPFIKPYPKDAKTKQFSIVIH